MEKIDFFLKLDKIQKNIECNLSYLVENYDELIDVTKNNDMKDELLEYNGDIKTNNEYKNSIVEKRNIYKKKLMEVNKFNHFIKDTLFDVCNHRFVKDNIDITCELSQEIHYCEICSCNYEDYLIHKKSK
jgi:hypothetical protein